MSNLFESIKQGLNEAVEYEKGNKKNIRVDKIKVSPIHSYTASEVKEIRAYNNMTQKLFAEALGVSVKTVEAWETGTNCPSGVANRMLELLQRDNTLFEKYSIIERH